MRRLLLCGTLLYGVSTIFAADPIIKAPPKNATPLPAAVFNFDHDSPGKAPKRFTLTSTGEGSAFRWEVQKNLDAPSQPNLLAQIGKGTSEENCAIALLDHVALQHGEAAVRFKIINGEENQSAGIVWRYIDPQNYYVLRASSKDDECAVYRMKKGKMKLLNVQSVSVSPYTWHDLRLIFVNNSFSAFVDGELVLGSKDNSFLEAGQIGLWTQGDSMARFDDLRVSH